MVPDCAPHVRKHGNAVRQTMYDFDMAIDRGDRDLALRLAKQLIVETGHLAAAVASWYFPKRKPFIVDPSWGLFPPTPPTPVEPPKLTPNRRRFYDATR